jgi:hypothetical protein
MNTHCARRQAMCPDPPRRAKPTDQVMHLLECGGHVRPLSFRCLGGVGRVRAERAGARGASSTSASMISVSTPSPTPNSHSPRSRPDRTRRENRRLQVHERGENLPPLATAPARPLVILPTRELPWVYATASRARISVVMACVCERERACAREGLRFGRVCMRG